jgi:hypothetical protein
MDLLTNTLLGSVPFTALAAVGIALLWKRRAVITALVAAGFCWTAFSYIVGALVGFYAIDGRGDFVAAMSRVGWTLPVTHWGIVLGLWVGSLSLLWDVLLRART